MAEYLDNSLNDTLPLRSAATVTRRFRSPFTTEQIEYLEQFFSHTPYPDVTTRENLSQRLNIEENRLQIWFSNRRARSRKTTASIPPAINQSDEQIPYFLPSTSMDIKPQPMHETMFNPTITSSPSMSSYEPYSVQCDYLFSFRLLAITIFSDEHILLFNERLLLFTHLHLSELSYTVFTVSVILLVGSMDIHSIVFILFLCLDLVGHKIKFSQ